MPNTSEEKLPRVSYSKKDYEVEIQLWRDGTWNSHGFPSYAPPTCLVVKDPKDISRACSQLHMVIPSDHTGKLYCLMFADPEFGMGTTAFGLYLRSKEEAKCITEKLAEFEARDKK
jgi:hypothetical protein